MCVNKIALSAYDDKRYIMQEKETNSPFGHYSLADKLTSKQRCNDTKWGIHSNDDDPVNVF